MALLALGLQIAFAVGTSSGYQLDVIHLQSDPLLLQVVPVLAAFPAAVSVTFQNLMHYVVPTRAFCSFAPIGGADDPTHPVRLALHPEAILLGLTPVKH
jgi:hypothetical protein